jgi:hypothetical protein
LRVRRPAYCWKRDDEEKQRNKERFCHWSAAQKMELRKSVVKDEF